MSQHDMNIANADFPTFRGDLNLALAALASSSAGPTAPATTYPSQLWFDETSNLLMVRNEGNTAWITVCELDPAANVTRFRGRAIRAVDANGLTLQTDEGTDRVTLTDDGRLGVGGSPAASTILDVQSTTRGFRPPVMTSAQRTAIASPVAGVFVYDTNLSAYVYWDGTQWVTIGSADDAGCVLWFAMSTPPAGFLKANGAAVSRTTYSRLFGKIGTTWGAGDGSTTFNLPDLRGEFIRGWDDARGIDTGRAFASAQTSQNLSHTHTATTDSAGAHTHTVQGFIAGGSGLTGGSIANGTATTSSAGAHTHTLTTAASGGTEARPRNVAMLACIKF